MGKALGIESEALGLYSLPLMNSYYLGQTT